MRTILRPALTISALAVALALSGCGEQVRSTYYRTITPMPSEMVSINDKRTLEETSGVVQAIVSAPDHKGMITLQLFLDENNQEPGREKAIKLGYQRAPE